MSKRKLKSRHMEELTSFIKGIKSVNYICKKFINESERMWISDDKKRLSFYDKKKNWLTLSSNGIVHLQYRTKKYIKYGKNYHSVPVGQFSIWAHFTKKEIYKILKGSKKALELTLKTKMFEELQ